MKVMFMTNLPSPYRVEFFNELGKRCELTVIYERLTATNRSNKWKGKSAQSFKEIYLSGKSIGKESSLSYKIINHLKYNKYDIIVLSGYSSPTSMIAITYLRMKKIPFILSSDGGIIKNDNKIMYMIKRSFISKASAWLSTGEMTSKYLIHYGAHKDKIYDYPFTSVAEKEVLLMPTSREKKENIKNDLKIPEEKVVLSVGQFIYRKGFDTLIKSCSKIDKNIGIYIVGGKATQEYINLKEQYGNNNLHFVDFKSKEELSKYYMAADVFVLPTREDIWGLVVNEAMSKGLPIITTYKCVAGTELVKNNGYLIPAENDEILAEKISMLMSGNADRYKMAKESLKTIKSYTIENMSKKHIEIFNSFLKK
ncbi:glycosyltransferase family 4 protein [Cytobacillus firmus]|uniref:glycosyltransferase family 4 protein n=1 Tax=Cytobacillus firmus TaxID=1399 RepID=UPI0021C90E14|nr:glycosyltransferase family 4 protein [Cytobacillus firmus]MCU1807113.1 glycosyltransferase family 4 protein [Cytobacillus firmus]